MLLLVFAPNYARSSRVPHRLVFQPKTPDWRGNLKEKGKEGEGEGGAEVNGEVDGPAEEEVEA